MALLIADGYTLEKTIPAKGRLPAVTFRYRPALPDAVHEFRYQFNSAKSGSARAAAEVTLLAAQLVSWDVVDNLHAMVPINPDTLKRVPQSVRDLMVDAVVYGIEEAEEDVKN
jgi:hypothetical protein